MVDASLPYAAVVEEYSGTTLANGTLAARYDYGDDLVRMDRTTPSVSTSYYLYDGLGSTRQLVSTAGAVTDTWGYTAFGEQVSRTGSTVNSFLFNAQQFDQPIGTYFLRARYYDQSNGRFLSQDPFEGVENDPVTLHRYLYASGDPVLHIDPSGNLDAAEVTFATSISAQIGLYSGAAVGALGGSLKDSLFAGLYGFTGASSVAYTAILNPGNLPSVVASGILGGFTSLLLTELVRGPNNQDVSPAKATLSFLSGFASSSLSSALGGGPLVKLLAGFDIALVNNLTKTITTDLLSNKSDGIWVEIRDDLIDASISGLFSLAKNRTEAYLEIKALNPNVDPNSAVSALLKVSPQQLSKIALDVYFKARQFVTKGSAKLLEQSYSNQSIQ